MSRQPLRRLLSAALGALLALPIAGSLSTPAEAAEPGFRALVFSKTAGFRHESIPAGHRGDPEARAGRTTSRSTRPRTPGRSPTRTWPGTTWSSGSPPPATCSTATSRPPSSATSAGGGGYAGVHAASDTEYDWPWYGKLVGAYFNSPPGRSRGHGQGRRPRAPVDRSRCRTGGPHRRVVQLPHQPARQRCTCSRPSTSESYAPAGGRDGHRATRSPGARSTTAAGPGTPASATPTPRTPSRTSSSTCSAGSGRRPGPCRRRLRGDRRRQLPAGHPRQGRGQDRRADDPRRAAGPARAAHRPRRRVCAAPTPHGNTSLAGQLPVYTHDEEGLQGVGGRPGLRHQPAGSTSTTRRRWTRPAGDAPDDGTAADFARLDGRQPAVPVHAQRRRHPRPGQRAEDPRRARQPGHLLPRRRRHRLRRGRQPLPVHR